MNDNDRLTARQTLIERMGVPVKEGRVGAGNIKTAYLEAGAGPDMVLVHGSGGGAVNWYKVISPLSQHFRIISPDVVGFGPFPRLVDYLLVRAGLAEPAAAPIG